MEKIKAQKLVPDTSIIIENIVSSKINSKEIEVEEIIIHEAVLGELEHQANIGKEIGILGLDELKKLQELNINKKIKLMFKGKRPNASEIKHASLGEIDSLIRDLALEENATLITGDKVQSEVAKAKGMSVIYIEPVIKSKPLTIDKYFDAITMSVHLRENDKPYAKRGYPGSWSSVELSTKELTRDEVINISKELIEQAKIRIDGFLEIERRGSTIIQLGNNRIVITRPPLSDGWEITIVRPIKKLNIGDYKMSEKLFKRITEQADGVLIAGSPGNGKSTFASSLAEYFASKNKTVKTIEAPRDLQLNERITQYSISYGSQQEIHDILLLSRPDYTVFDEMRNYEDFRLFSDLRLSGIGLFSVVHATNPVDAIQRFIGKTELGIIPQIIDTVIFIKNGTVNKVLTLKMTVKVPSGMTEEDLSRPIVEVRDFETNTPEFEIYSYGEETIVVPVQETKKGKKTGAKELAAKQIEREFGKIIDGEVKAEILNDNKAVVYVPEYYIARIIGKEGKNIEEIEKRLGISIDIEDIKNVKTDLKANIEFKINEDKRDIVFYVNDKHTGKSVEILIDNDYLCNLIVGKKGNISVNKKSDIGYRLLKALNDNKEVSITS
ncbi:Flp pilus assembly complex ATPase component TadA [Candidatus Woesearchaeota archaeon]|nr:Flp pilus assembly complex ATPase component TadA [Candidatus Woesearchaeota archaeon]